LLNSAKEKGERLREKGGKMAVNVKKEVRISEIRTAIRSRELWKMAIRKISIFNIINFFGIFHLTPDFLLSVVIKRYNTTV